MNYEDAEYFDEATNSGNFEEHRKQIVSFSSTDRATGVPSSSAAAAAAFTALASFFATLAAACAAIFATLAAAFAADYLTPSRSITVFFL